MRSINGVRLKERITELVLFRDLKANQFTQSIKVFKSQKFLPIEAIDSDLTQTEVRIARLQAVQAVYNTTVRVECAVVSEKPVLLDVLINVVGAYGRATTRWTENARGGSADKYRYRSETRVDGEEAAEFQLEPDVAVQIMMNYKRGLNKIRSAIQVGNMTEYEIDDEVYRQLFED